MRLRCLRNTLLVVEERINFVTLSPVDISGRDLRRHSNANVGWDKIGWQSILSNSTYYQSDLPSANN